MSLAVAIGCALTATAFASPESARLVRAGVADLQRHDFPGALRKFEAATRADNGDLEALFYQGVAANRLGRFAAARETLSRAAARGLARPDLDFELGWSAMGLGRWHECVQRLERYEHAAAGRGQTSEFLGRCHLALREDKQAERLFKQAVARDPRLAPTVDLFMAALLQRRGAREQARASYAAAAAADTPSGRALRELAGPPLPLPQPAKPLRLSLTFSVGHNDNVIGLGNTIPLPRDISGKGADFVRLAFGAAYTRRLDARSFGTLGYALLVDRYDGLAAANLNDHYLYGDLFHQLTRRAGASLRLSSEYTELGGSAFRDVWAARPALSYRFTPYSVTELSYTYADARYRATLAAPFRRSGPVQTVALLHSFRVPRSRWGGAVAGSYTRNRPEGSDFVFNGWALSLTGRYTFANRVIAALGASYERDDYVNPNSLAGAGFAFARSDSQSALSAQLSGPLTRRTHWFAHVQRLRNRSNISFYDFEQNVVSAGLAASF